jgi:hypothetical protein
MSQHGGPVMTPSLGPGFVDQNTAQGETSPAAGPDGHHWDASPRLLRFLVAFGVFVAGSTPSSPPVLATQLLAIALIPRISRTTCGGDSTTNVAAEPALRGSPTLIPAEQEPPCED